MVEMHKGRRLLADPLYNLGPLQADTLREEKKTESFFDARNRLGLAFLF